jgi:hypothetical protein
LPRIAAGEHKSLQLGGDGFFHSDIQDIAQPLDVGAKQRCRVLQPRPGVDHAVVHLVAAVHRLAHGGGVEDVTVKTGDFQIVDAAGIGASAHHGSHVGARGDKLAGDMRTQKAVGADDQLGSAH